MTGTSAFHLKQTLGQAAYLSVDSSMLITFGPGMSKPLGLIGAMIAHDNAMFVSRDEGRNVRGAVAGAPDFDGRAALIFLDGGVEKFQHAPSSACSFPPRSRGLGVQCPLSHVARGASFDPINVRGR